MVSPRQEKLIKNQEISKIIAGLLAAKYRERAADTLQENQSYIRNFFSQDYFRGDASLISKLLEVKNDLTGNDIKDETISLGKIYSDSSKLWDFKSRLDGCHSEFIQSLAQNIYDKVKGEVSVITPLYNDFDTECPIPAPLSSDILIGYIQDINDYLIKKENEPHAKKANDIRKDLTISNEEINSKLTHPLTLTDRIREPFNNNVKSFDILLKFEIGQNVDAFIDYSETATNQVANLFSNALPGINTLITNSGYKYDEGLFQEAKKDEIKAIKEDPTKSDREKEKEIGRLRRNYYIEYVKSKNSDLGNTLEKLHANNFDYSKLEDTELQKYLTQITEINFQKMIQSDFLRSAFHINFGNDLDEFKNFYRDLGDTSKNTINLLGSISISVTKKIIPGPHPRLNDLYDLFGDNPKPWDSLPIEFTIKKDDIKGLPVEDMSNLLNFLSQVESSENENEYVFQGEDVGKLIYLFFIANSKHSLLDIDLDKQKEIEKIFGEKGDGDHKDSNHENSIEDPTDTPEKFIEEIETLGNGNTKFENGAEIWAPVGDSEIPGGGKERVKIKLSNIDKDKGTFSGTIFGGELGVGKNEGVSRDFNMNTSTIKKIKELSNDKSTLILLPNPDAHGFNEHKNLLGGKLNKSIEFKLPEREDDHFTYVVKDENGQEKKEKAEYFGATNGDPCSYRIKYHPNKRKFTVCSDFIGDEQNPKGKDKAKVKYTYEREMDWNNFLIFMNEKKLIPQTPQAAEENTKKQNDKLAKDLQKGFKMNNGSKLKLNRFSISSFQTVFKSITKKVKGQLDAYNKSQSDKLEDIFIRDWGLYKKLGNVLGFIPSMKDAFGNLQQEYYNKSVNGNWAHIEGYLKGFQADEQFGDTFESLPPHIKTQNGKSLKDRIENRFLQNNVALEESEEIWQSAALCLANLQKGGSLYRGLTKYEDQGFWVKVLLGSDHRENFKERKAACIRDLQSAIKSGNSDREKELQGILSTCEIDYICNNINGSNGKLEYFGSRTNRGIPNTTDNNNYIVNPEKAILSEKFAKELGGAKSWLTKNSVEEAYKKTLDTHRDFSQAKEDVTRLMKSSRHPGGIGNFEAMLNLAREGHQIDDCKKYFLVYMLSGVLDKYGNKGLRDQAYEWARTRGFAPGMLAKNSFHSEGVADLLQDFSPDFKSCVNKYFQKKDFLPEDESTFNTSFSELLKQFNSRWDKDPDRSQKFDDYLHIVFPTKDFSKKPLLGKLQKKLNENCSDNLSSVVLGNASLMKDARLLAPPSAVRKMLEFDNGIFAGEGTEPNDKADFWNACTINIQKQIDNGGYNDEAVISWILNKYLGWFGLDSIDSKQTLWKYINTARYYKEKINSDDNPNKGLLYYTPISTKTIHDRNTNSNKEINIPLGKIYNKEIKQILLYGFEGSVWSHRFRGSSLPPQLKATLDTFQSFFLKAFENGKLDNVIKHSLPKSYTQGKDRFLLGGWDKFNLIKTKDNELNLGDNDNEINGDDFTRLSQKDQKKLLKSILQQEKYINNDMERMERSIKRSNYLTGDRALTNDFEIDPNDE